jgi:hypothetical protein
VRGGDGRELDHVSLSLSASNSMSPSSKALR